MSSSDGLRLARVAERRGWRFPRFSPDEVVQFCVEEALIGRCEALDRAAADEQARRDAVRAAQDRAAAEISRRRSG